MGMAQEEWGTDTQGQNPYWHIKPVVLGPWLVTMAKVLRQRGTADRLGGECAWDINPSSPLPIIPGLPSLIYFSQGACMAPTA